ncbi:copper homeostasis protein CutC [Rhizobium sp. CFBP 8762]|uniref:copper homeostasis protein CutC n=1 Tax=Rhizobium sp. CFBP 8762 TaxID=2775279 RepID=UPI00177EDA78|nr:copper homeostasis protein CutC [Rhizobium sp. CFBP 8762]MBD8554092.1 copper homeostasis protein CutC [Rhizobium sp. CFBP 8762]
MVDRLLEVCVDSASGLHAAVNGGADRIELCSALAVGGLTPSAGLMAEAATVDIPVYAMIRPRSGDFVFNDADCAVMIADIQEARSAGLAGVVLGASLADGRLNGDMLRVLIKAAAGVGCSLHRAFDLVPDVSEAVELAIELGFERILTSGRAPTVSAGLDDLRRVHDVAAGRISIMPGAGVTIETLPDILARVPVNEVHASCGVAATPQPNILRMGFALPSDRMTDEERVRTLKAALNLHAEHRLP